MGQLVADNSALVSPQGQTEAIGAPRQVMAQANKQLQAQPSPEAQMGPDVLNPKPVGQNANLPSIGKPSFLQAATSGPQGMPNAASPGLSKAGKLVTLLTSGLRGALAGRAASEQTVAQTGGRRSGGAGMGFQAGVAQPYQQAEMGQNLAQQQAQTQLTRAQGDTVNIPGVGPMPAWLAKSIAPASIQAGAKRDVQGMKGETAENVANTASQTQEKIHRFIPVPNVGLFDSQARQVIPETAQGIPITQEIIDDNDLPQDFLNKRMSLQQLASVRRADVFQNAPMMTAEGPVVVNRKNSTATPVTGPGGARYGPPALASPMEVADTEQPGQTKVVPKGQAFGQAGVGSASVTVPKKALGAEVPTKIGDQRVAFTTMIQHAELLRDAAKALQNGDIQTLAGLKNAFKNEFGYSGPITARAIADAYGGEVTNVIAKGHITDAEMARTGRTLDPSKQNYETINSVLNGYQALAQSKMKMLDQQEQGAIQKSQPKRPGKAPVNTAADPLGIR